MKTNHTLTAALCACLFTFAIPQFLRAGSATWNSNPGDGNWNNNANWSPASAPNGSADTATFGVSVITGISLSASTQVASIAFNAGASGFTITSTPSFFLTISGAGITNNSGVMQNFVADVDGSGNAGFIEVTNNATAGALTRFTNNGATLAFAFGGRTQFFGTASAGNGTFRANGGTVTDANGGFTTFSNSSTAGSGTFITNGGTANRARGGVTNFYNGSSAESGNFTTNGGAASGAFGANVEFNDHSTADNGAFINNGGASSPGITSFYQSASAGAGTFTNNAGGGTYFFDNSTASNGTFANNGRIGFDHSATAGSATFTNNGGTVSYAFGAFIFFSLNATAGNGVFTNNGGGAIDAVGGEISFAQTASAGSAIITNNGGGVASGAQGASTRFSGDSTAGNGTFTNNGGANGGGTVFGVQGALTSFSERASAGNGTFTNNGGAVIIAGGGVTRFLDNSTAATATFTSNGGMVAGGMPGATEFRNNSTAGNSILIANGAVVSGGGRSRTTFTNTATAANATLIANGGSGGANGGSIRLEGDSSGGTARVEVFGNGRLDLSLHNPPGVTIGSLEGTGAAFLGARNLTVGSSDLSTTLSGVIQDGGTVGGTGGSLTKIGTGTLSVSGANIYTGPTMITGGRLMANNSTGSGTSSGAVTVANSGSVLGGTGCIGGPVTVNPGSVLLGGNAATPSGSLKVANDLALNAGSIIELTLGAAGAHSTLTRTGGTWTFAPNQRFTFLDVGAQTGLYDNIITGLAADPGGTASWTITNAGFAGTFGYDGAGNIDLNITAAFGPALQLTDAVSRKTHGGAGDFDVPLPLTGEPGVEFRSSGGNHTLVFSFTSNVVSGNASVTSGTGVAGSPIFAANTLTVNLTGVANAQTVTLTLTNVTDSLAQVLPDTVVIIGFLVGDTNGNRVVNSGDVLQTRNRAGGTVDATTFRSDVNADGALSSGDTTVVRGRSGTFLP